MTSFRCGIGQHLDWKFRALPCISVERVSVTIWIESGSCLHISKLKRGLLDQGPELAAELADAEVEYDRMTGQVAWRAQEQADLRTDKRREKFASIQEEINRLPASPQRAAAQAFLDDADLGAWEGDEWQTQIRRLMQGEVDTGY